MEHYNVDVYFAGKKVGTFWVLPQDDLAITGAGKELDFSMTGDLAVHFDMKAKPTAPSTPGVVPFTLAKIPVSSVGYSKVTNSSLSQVILPQVFKIMGLSGQSAVNWSNGITTAAARESSYNLNAINNYDSNATGADVADGYPANCSRGVLQCIPPTFAAYHQQGTSNDIYDGVANVCAAMNYVVDRYGVSVDGSDLASKVPQFNPNHAPQGY